MSKQTVKEAMQQALDFLQAFAPRAHRMGKSSHVNAINLLVQAIADYEQAEKPEPNSQLYNAARAMTESYINLVDSEHGNFWTKEREKIHANMVDALKQEPHPSSVRRLSDNEITDRQRLDWLDKNCTRVVDSERYIPRIAFWGKGSKHDVRSAIDKTAAIMDAHEIQKGEEND